ncbi:hypothetical protein [Virgibacillus siamensis]|uniref:hypothetical protein n=1 Tax=Virgibacillus siamensis TaxID=480071 RepID=UPI000986344A|nr:hypothetical protein [Virgibacillus siamensis]
MCTASNVGAMQTPEEFCGTDPLICLYVPPVTLNILGVTLKVQLPGFSVSADLGSGVISEILELLISLLQAILDAISGALTGSSSAKTQD